MCLPTSAGHPESRGLASLQPTLFLSHCTAPPCPTLPMLLECDSSNYYFSTVLEMTQARPTSGHGQTIHPSQLTMLCYCQMACYSLSMKGAHLPLRKIPTVCKVPTGIRTAETLYILCHRLKTHLFRLHLGPCQEKGKKNILHLL